MERICKEAVAVLTRHFPGGTEQNGETFRRAAVSSGILGYICIKSSQERYQNAIPFCSLAEERYRYAIPFCSLAGDRYQYAIPFCSLAVERYPYALPLYSLAEGR
jgi:hypothetical protein